MDLKSFICTNCGWKGEPVTLPKGDVMIEFILWGFFIIPGIIYSLWSRSNKLKMCPLCNAKNMIPLYSPRGQKLLKDFDTEK